MKLMGSVSSSLLPLAVILVAASLYAQTSAGSIATQPIPVFGASVIDPAGNVYSIGFGPVTPGAAQTQPGGGTCYFATGYIGSIPTPCSDAYVGKVDAAGNMIFGTLLGGSTADSAKALALDSAGAVYIVGSTGGSFPTTPNAAISSATSSTAFAAKLSADGSRFIYSTYLPAALQTASAIAVDAQGNAYVAGQTATGHAYVIKLNADGSAFLYTKVLTGTNQESGNAIAIDSAGDAVVAGYKSSPDFPVTAGVVQSRLAGTQNAFVTTLDTVGNIKVSTYLGGTASDSATALQLDSQGNIYVTGLANSLDFPTTSGSFQPSPIVPPWNFSPGGFVAKLTRAGALAYSSYVMSYLSATSYLSVTSIAVGASGDVWLAANTGAGFPVTASAPQPCFGAGSDIFVAHLDSGGALRDATYLGGIDASAFGLTVAGDGSVLLVWRSLSSSPTLDTPSPGTVLSQIRFGGPGWIAPACLSQDALNSATLFSFGSVAPGEFVSLTGSGIGPLAGVAYQPGPAGQVPLELSGVKVFFDGLQAPLLYVQSRQVNVLAPFELSGRTNTVISLEYNGVVFDPVPVTVHFSDPAVFRLQPNSAQAVAVNQNGTLNGPANPASPGSVISVWGTGFGSTNPSCATGGFNVPAAASLATGLSILLYPITTVEYAGSAPTLLCGVEQINFMVPVNALPGPLTMSMFERLPSGNTIFQTQGFAFVIAVK